MSRVDAAHTGAGAIPIAPESVDALLFDFGGVVIEIDFERVFARWAAHAGCDAGAIRSRFAHDARYQRHERGEIDAAAYFDSLRGSLGIALTDAQFRDGWDAVFVGEMPGAAALLRRAAAQLPLYLFTNTNFAHQETWSRRYEVTLKPFRRVFASCALGLRKPDQAAFRSVAREMGVAPERIAFFDDTAENVAGARFIGMQAVQVRSVAQVEQCLREILERPLRR